MNRSNKSSINLRSSKSSANFQSGKPSTNFQSDPMSNSGQKPLQSPSPHVQKASLRGQNPSLRSKNSENKRFEPSASKSFKVKHKQHLFSICARLAVWGAAIFVSGTVLAIIGYILAEGIPHLRPTLFEWQYSSKNASMMPAIINTLTLTAISLAISVPVGVFSAVYLTEYAPRESRLVKLIRLTAETLAGIPSIVYGLFGYLVFHSFFGWGYSLLGGALTLSLMVLPMIIRTAEEAITSVPDSYREGSFGLGAGKLRTTLSVVLPSAVPGILSGVILAVGRIVGETAALIYTAGSVTGIAESVMSSGRTLAVHMFALLSEGLYINEAKATAVVLLVLVLLINLVSRLIANKLKGREK